MNTDRWKGIVQHAGFASVFLLGAFLLYQKALTAPFLFDDLHLTKARNLHSLEHFSYILMFNRPMVGLAHALLRQFAGMAPAACHALLIGLHGLNAFLLALVVRNWLRLYAPAGEDHKPVLVVSFLAGALFLAHPLLSMAVVLVACLPELLCLFFYLLGLLLFLRWRDRLDGLAWIGVSFAYFAATMSKEMAISFVPACYLLHVMKEKDLFRPLRKYWKFYLALAVFSLLLVFKVLRMDYGGTVGIGASEAPQMPYNRWEFLMTQVTIGVHFLKTFLAPLPTALNADWDFPIVRSPLSLVFLCCLLVWAAIACALFRLARGKQRLVAWSGAMVVLAALPVSSIIPLADPLMEYRFYLPAMYLCLTIAALALWAYLRWGARRRWARVAMVGAASLAVIVLMGLLTQRLTTYQSVEAFWRDAKAKSPNKIRPRYNLAHNHLITGRLDEAEAECRALLKLAPDNCDAQSLLGDILRERGDLPGAYQQYRQALALKPRSTDLANRLAYLLIMTGRYADAFALLEQVPIKYRNSDYFLNLAIYFSHTGKLTESLAAYHTVLAMEPDSVVGWTNMGSVLHRLGNWNGAEDAYRTALRYNPDYYLATLGLGLLYHDMRRINEAIGLLRKSIEQNPHYALTYYELGNLLAQEKFYAMARNEFSTYVRLEPRSANGWRKLGILNQELGDPEQARACFARAEALDAPKPVAGPKE